MLGFECIGTMSSDCTTPYYFSMDHPYSVKDFIEDMLAQFPNEWGHIQLYKHREVYMAEAWAGFSRMDIVLTLQTKGFESWNTEVH